MSNFQPVKILSAQEEVEYAKLAAAGDNGAKEKLILSNMPFVHYCAKSYRGKGLSYDDLILEGAIGLIEAVNRFDYAKGVRLLTYSKFWIIRYLQNAVNKRRSENYRLISFDATFNSDGDEAAFGDKLADTQNLSVEEECENNIKKERLWSAIDGLKPNEREILILHYGLQKQVEHSFSEIGAIKGKSRARMQQIEQKAFSRLRDNLELLAS